MQAPIEGRSSRVVVTRYVAMPLAQARRPARAMLDRIRAGGNPADDIRREKQAPTFGEFTEEYLRRTDPHWKPSGRETVSVYLKARILPAFGKMLLDRMGPEDLVACFDAASMDKPGPVNRALEIPRAMMFRAEKWGLRECDTNPCLGIAMNPRKEVARFLDTDELARLGRALDNHEARWSDAVAAIRLLALIETLPGPRDPDAFLFPRYAEGRGVCLLTNCCRTGCADAKLGRVIADAMKEADLELEC